MYLLSQQSPPLEARFGENVFSYYRMCSLAIECVPLPSVPAEPSARSSLWRPVSHIPYVYDDVTYVYDDVTLASCKSYSLCV